MKFKVFPLLTILVTSLAGCTNPFPDTPLPRAIVDEMNLLGATIFTEDASAFENVDTRLDSTVEPPQIIGQINLFIAPRSADSIISLNGILNEELETIPYRFTFSTNVDGSFMELPPSSEAHYSSESIGAYSGHLLPYANEAELHGEGNYVLTSSRQLRIPVTATHVELWFQSDLNTNRELVRRVPLSSLSGWQKWFRIASGTAVN